MKKFEEWLAATATGSLVKIAGGAALGALLSYLTTADVHPLIVAIGAAVIPIAINAINPQDPRYGTVDWNDLDG
jgi:Na+-transporting methylmalonyl-CoA/oxaloacetate decarboxylase beta subunit